MAIVRKEQPDILYRSHVHTDEQYGKRPSERTVEQMIELGVVILDKPPGPTSHRVTEIAAKLIGAKRAGHIGTLDPDVSGVLPILLNRSTKAAGYLMAKDKKYVGIAQFHKDISEKQLRNVVDQFIGQITQVPPVRSAVARRPRQRQIHSFDILEICGRSILFKTKVQAGTYIRKLIDDIGKQSRIGAHMAELRRIEVGSISEKDSVTLHSLTDAVWLWKEKNDNTFVKRYIKNLEDFITNKKVWISDNAIDSVCSGAPLHVPGLVKCEQSIKDGDVVAILSLKDELIGFGKAQLNANDMITEKSGVAVKIEKVIMEKGTYPGWKKKTDKIDKNDVLSQDK